MGKQESSYEVHAQFDNTTHADILLYKQATGEWNYHLRLCDGLCDSYSTMITASQKPDPGNAPSIQILFDVDRCIYHNGCVNVFVVKLTIQSSMGNDGRYVSLLNFFYPNVEERKFFTLLPGSIGDLILFAKGQLVEGLFVDAASFRSSTVERKPSVPFEYLPKKGFPTVAARLSTMLGSANPPIIIHCENPPGRASIEYGKFYSGVGDYDIVYGGFVQTIIFKNVPVEAGECIPHGIFESWGTHRNHESGAVMLRGELSKKYTVEIHGSMGSITHIKGRTG